MIDGTLLVILMVVGWFAIGWVRTSNQINNAEREREEAVPSIKKELKKLGVADEKIQNISYYSGLDLIEEIKERNEKEERLKAIEREKSRQERIKRENEWAKKEQLRIEESYRSRPSLNKMEKSHPQLKENLFKDYLEVDIYGNGGEFQFLYVDKSDAQIWKDYIEEGIIPENIDENDLEYELDESFVNTHYTAIYDVELGNKDQFNKYTVEDYTEEDENIFGDFIMSKTGLNGSEDGFVVIKYTHSKKHRISGVIGLEFPLSKTHPLNKEFITFHETYFKIGSRKFDYDEFDLGEYEDWWNQIYTVIVPVSELKNISQSDVWN